MEADIQARHALVVSIELIGGGSGSSVSRPVFNLGLMAAAGRHLELET